MRIFSLSCQNLGHGPEAVAAVKRAAASSDEHEGDHPDAPAVGGRRRLRALQHLGRDELQGAAHLRNFERAVLGLPPRESEVGDLEHGVVVARGEDDAEGLEVEVDDAARVDVPQALADLPDVVLALGLVEHEVGASGALDEVAAHHEVGHDDRGPRRGEEGVQADDGRLVAHPVQDGRLPPRGVLVGAHVLGREHLARDGVLDAEESAEHAVVHDQVQLFESVFVVGEFEDGKVAASTVFFEGRSGRFLFPLVVKVIEMPWKANTNMKWITQR